MGLVRFEVGFTWKVENMTCARVKLQSDDLVHLKAAPLRSGSRSKQGDFVICYDSDTSQIAKKVL